MSGMMRLLVVVAIVLLASSSWAGDSLKAQLAPDPERPNIVLILTDDMRADELRYMPKTRGLLASEGVTFENAFVSNTVCCPSRATILTGLYPHNHGVFSTSGERHGGLRYFKKSEDATIATALDGAGYRTVLAGKYLNGYDDTTISHVPPGWDSWNAWIPEGKPQPAVDGDYQTTTISEDGVRADYPLHQTDLITTKAIDEIHQTSSEPLFIHLSYSTPHVGLVPPERYANLEVGGMPKAPSFNERVVRDKPPYISTLPRLSAEQVAQIEAEWRERVRNLQALDDSIEKIVSALEESGKLDETYILLTSDHGYHMGEHRLTPMKLTAFEEDVRVPMVVRGPGVQGEVKKTRMVLNNDIAPTLAAWGSASLTVEADGRSFAKAIDGVAENNPPARRAFLVEKWYHRVTPGNFRAIRTDRWKLVRHEGGQRELYDLMRDPAELTNLYGKRPRVQAKLQRQLKKLASCEADGCRTSEN